MKNPAFIVLLVVLLPGPGWAGERTPVPLPAEVPAQAEIVMHRMLDEETRTLVVRFPSPMRLLSTRLGFAEKTVVMNHGAPLAVWNRVCRGDGRTYERMAVSEAARRVGIAPDEAAYLSTAADIRNLAAAVESFDGVTVAALVTAGARTNAQRAGVDRGDFVEWKTAPSEASSPPFRRSGVGTVNIILLTNARLKDEAMARLLITATEAKVAAFEDLNVPSSYTPGAQATGTGTDEIIVVSGTGPVVTCAGGHCRFGEMAARAVKRAVEEGLGKQNGFKRRPAGREP
ncbi:MAG: adenosylcobinamide amidohydrolase [Nitrospirae bacterium]|nr:adenosylcobinamide amidohydrolase [Nitrospirota bacterium]